MGSSTRAVTTGTGDCGDREGEGLGDNFHYDDRGPSLGASPWGNDSSRRWMLALIQEQWKWRQKSKRQSDDTSTSSSDTYVQTIYCHTLFWATSSQISAGNNKWRLSFEISLETSLPTQLHSHSLSPLALPLLLYLCPQPAPPKQQEK